MLLTGPYWAGELFFFPCKEYLNLEDVRFIIPLMVTFFSSVYVDRAMRVKWENKGLVHFSDHF